MRGGSLPRETTELRQQNCTPSVPSDSHAGVEVVCVLC